MSTHRGNMDGHCARCDITIHNIRGRFCVHCGDELIIQHPAIGTPGIATSAPTPSRTQSSVQISNAETEGPERTSYASPSVPSPTQRRSSTPGPLQISVARNPAPEHTTSTAPRPTSLLYFICQLMREHSSNRCRSNTLRKRFRQPQ